MACGCPVITCKNSSLIEVVGDAALFVSDSDPTQTFLAIESLKSEVLRENLTRWGYAQVEKFDFKNTAKSLFEAISSIKKNESVSKESVNKIFSSFRLNQQSLQNKLIDEKELSLQNNEMLKNLEIQIKGNEQPNLLLLLNEISRTAETNPGILLDRLATKTLIRETGSRLKQYPLRKIKRSLPPRIKKLIKKLLNYK